MVDDSENQDDSDLSTEESGREESENGSYWPSIS
jgi:hypothetical protein